MNSVVLVDSAEKEEICKNRGIKVIYLKAKSTFKFGPLRIALIVNMLGMFEFSGKFRA